MAITETATERRTPLNRERVLAAAVELADREGIEALSMRRLGQELSVEAMALYNHVANKDDLLNGMVDAVVGEVDLTDGADGDWKMAARNRILAARRVMRRHPWASAVIASRTDASLSREAPSSTTATSARQWPSSTASCSGDEEL